MSQYIFPKDTTKIDHTSYYWFKNGFSEEEIKKIKTLLEKYKYQESTTFSGSDKSVRDSKIKWIPYQEDTDWLYQKIYNMAKESNDEQFKFHLYYAKDNIQYSKYSLNGKYDWHMDIGQGKNSLRKLSCSILLNDPKEFVGGDLEFWVNKNPIKVPLEKGSVIFFPSFFLHRVTEIKRGERESLVLWIGGDSYH
tara:strand:+ start:1270 stop:1851 length:582 start_codon:yes stop_codon:yes gene_type:complete